jgi:hypothetical protein
MESDFIKENFVRVDTSFSPPKIFHYWEIEDKNLLEFLKELKSKNKIILSVSINIIRFNRENVVFDYDEIFSKELFMYNNQNDYSENKILTPLLEIHSLLLEKLQENPGTKMFFNFILKEEVLLKKKKTEKFREGRYCSACQESPCRCSDRY